MQKTSRTSHESGEHGHGHVVDLKLSNKFIEYLHGTDLWASHLPRIPKILAAIAFVGMAVGIVSIAKFDVALLRFSGLGLGILLLLPAIFASRFAYRKWRYAINIRKQVLNSIPWRGDEQVLDVGCGSGLLLNAVATKITSGKALGIDIWAAHGGGGNLDLLWANARAEGVADKIEFKQADVKMLPFEDASFDVIVSSGALHHISRNFVDHELAINEMVRVLKPGGRIVLWDTTHMVTAYASRMKSAGISSAVSETKNSPFGFEMSMMVGQKSK